MSMISARYSSHLQSNVSDVGEPDPVRCCGPKVAIDEVWRDRQAMTAVGNAVRPGHDGADAVPMR